MNTKQLLIESLDLAGQGVAHDEEGKVDFVEGALPGERVRVEPIRSRKNYDRARAIEILEPTSLRVAPACQYSGTCGGCVMHHLDLGAHIAVNQLALEAVLPHL